jgi:hypothetical protein
VCTKGRDVFDAIWMNCAYKEFLVHGAKLQTPIPITQGINMFAAACRQRVNSTKLAAPCSVARVRPRTSKGITDLLLLSLVRLSRRQSL